MTELLLAAGLVLILDHSSKALVVRWLPNGQRRQPGRLVQIRRVENREAVLALLRSRTTLSCLWTLAVVITAGLVWVPQPVGAPGAYLGVGAALGGATGNLVDRLGRGAVVDFIDLGFWPVFNVADAAIVLGLGVALWFSW